LFVLALNVVLGGLATQYVLTHWVSFVQHRAVSVPFFPCVMAGMFVGQFTIPLAILTWVLTFMVGGL